LFTLVKGSLVVPISTFGEGGVISDSEIIGSSVGAIIDSKFSNFCFPLASIIAFLTASIT
jgi:hypothetical protein